jgi:hypothetical protein
MTASKKKTFPVSNVLNIYTALRHVSDLNIQTYKPLRARALTTLSYIAGELTKLAEAIDVTEAGRKAFIAEQKAIGVLDEVRWFWRCLYRLRLTSILL